MLLKGLEQGIEALEVRIPKADDLVFFHGSITQMEPGNVAIYSPELIVGLLPGYLRQFDMNTGEFLIIKAPTPVKVKASQRK